MKVAIFGDIGGHNLLFQEALELLGCDTEKGTVPDGLTIVQVGDLIDRGPDSDGVVEMVDRFIRSDQWIQLDGNHESRFLGGPEFFNRTGTVSEPSEAAVETLRGWRGDGHLHHAVSILRDQGNEFLVTHGGLARGLWDYMGKPDARNAADLINNLPYHMAYRSGLMLSGGRMGPREDVGVVWAAAWDELVVSWLSHYIEDNDQVMPFHQVHGHCTLYHWGKKKHQVHPSFENDLTFDPKTRMSKFKMGESFFFQVDTALGQYASFVPKPLILNDVKEIVT